MAVDLLDLAPQVERVEVPLLGGTVEIRALTVTEMGKLMKRFPDFRRAFFSDDVPEDVRSASLMECWPAIVAAGLGHPGDSRYEQTAEALPLVELLALGTAVMNLSMPRAPEQKGPLPAGGSDDAAGTEPTSSPPQ
jgi:hypothetical protein